VEHQCRREVCRTENRVFDPTLIRFGPHEAPWPWPDIGALLHRPLKVSLFVVVFNYPALIRDDDIAEPDVIIWIFWRWNITRNPAHDPLLHKLETLLLTWAWYLSGSRLRIK